MKLSMKGNNLTAAKFIALYAVILMTLVHAAAYGLIAEFNATRNLDYSRLVLLPIDNYIPYWGVFIIPYLGAWIIPLLITIYFVRKSFDISLSRIMIIAYFLLMIIVYAIYLLFPVKVHLLVPNIQLEQGLLNYIVRWFYSVAAGSWNSIPSFHCAFIYFFWRIADSLYPKIKTFLFICMLVIFASTVLIRVHYVLDVVFGVVYAELIYLGLFYPMAKHKAVFLRLGNRTTFVITTVCSVIILLFSFWL